MLFVVKQLFFELSAFMFVSFTISCIVFVPPVLNDITGDALVELVPL